MNGKIYSIALVVVYYGPFNNYFNLWLKSVAMNPTVDFLIITDNKPPKECPENVHFIPLTFKEVHDRFQKLFAFKILLHPYKLCDFRPAYGDAFSDYLEGYDFWGHCDSDVIFGDIRKFLSSEILQQYENVLQRGHFCLYKNNEKCRKLYLKTAETNNMAYPYDKAFTTGHTCYFDEYLGMGIVTDIYCDKVLRDQHIEKIVLDVQPGRYELYSVVHKKEYYCEWRNGKLYRYFKGEEQQTPEEFMYIHLQKRPMNIEISPDLIPSIDSFYILPDKFSLSSNYTITEEMRKKRKESNQKKALLRIASKFLKYGPIAAIQHKLQMKKTISWLNHNKPGF